MIPIDEIIKATYKHNYEFAFWFKAFYDDKVEKTGTRFKTSEPKLPTLESLVIEYRNRIAEEQKGDLDPKKRT